LAARTSIVPREAADLWSQLSGGTVRLGKRAAGAHVADEKLVWRGSGKWCSLLVALWLGVVGIWSIATVSFTFAACLTLALGALIAFATLSSRRWASSLNLVVGFLLLPRITLDLLREPAKVVADVPLFILAASTFYLLNRQLRAASMSAEDIAVFE
jgi:hypothetical protein